MADGFDERHEQFVSGDTTNQKEQGQAQIRHRINPRIRDTVKCGKYPSQDDGNREVPEDLVPHYYQLSIPNQDMKRTRRSDVDLYQASEHLGYEYQMFIQLAVRLAGGEPADRFLHNAALESFIIHVRNILDFLYASDKVLRTDKYDDIIAEDYFDDPSVWHKERPVKSRLLEQSHQRAHKEVAHLTYARVGKTDEDKQWRFLDIASEVNQTFNRFREIVPSQRLQPFEWVVIEVNPERT